MSLNKLPPKPPYKPPPPNSPNGLFLSLRSDPMKKRFILIAAALLIIGGLAAFLVNRQLDPESTLPPASMRELASFASNTLAVGQLPITNTIEPIPSSKALRLAIGSLGLTDDSQNGQLADLLTANLSGEKGLELVERQSLDKVLAELHLSLSHLVRASDAVRVGQLLRADWFLLGTPLKAGGSNSVVVRIVDARTGIMRDTGVVSA